MHGFEYEVASMPGVKFSWQSSSCVAGAMTSAAAGFLMYKMEFAPGGMTAGRFTGDTLFVRMRSRISSSPARTEKNAVCVSL